MLFPMLSKDSGAVKAQTDNPSTDIFTGIPFRLQVFRFGKAMDETVSQATSGMIGVITLVSVQK